MLRVVMDTSSLISYVLARGDLMQRIMAQWEARKFVVLSSPQTRAELAAVLACPVIAAASGSPVRRLVDGIERYTEHVPGRLDLTGACRDGKDDKVLACAVEGGVHYLISSDHDLLALRRYHGVAILNPGQFLVALELHPLDPHSLAERYRHEVLAEIRERVPLETSTLARLEAALEAMT